MWSRKMTRHSDCNSLPDKELTMKTLILMLLAAANPVEPNVPAPTYGLPPVQECANGVCPMPQSTLLPQRTVQWSQPINTTVAVQTPVTTMVEQVVEVPVQKTITVMEEQTVQVPVTTMETSCVQCQTASVPLTVTRTRRVGFFGRWIAKVRQRRTARRSARSTNGC